MRRIALLTVAVACSFLLSGCAETTTTTLNGSTVTTTTRPLATKIYRTTDELMKYSRAVVTTDAPIVVSTIGNVSAVETSSPFGRMVSEQVAGRLAQLGYRVQEVKLRNSLNVKQGLTHTAEAGEFLTSRDVSAIAGGQQAAAAVIGTYADAGDRVVVNLKLVDIATGRIVSNRDFDVNKTADIMNLMHEDARRSNSFFGSGWAY